MAQVSWERLKEVAAEELKERGLDPDITQESSLEPIGDFLDLDEFLTVLEEALDVELTPYLESFKTFEDVFKRINPTPA